MISNTEYAIYFEPYVKPILANGKSVKRVLTVFVSFANFLYFYVNLILAGKKDLESISYTVP